jgi:ABC-type multidrug transport system ATPase subunit
MCQELLELKKQGKTVLLVSHDVDMVYRYCDRVVLFKGGNVLFDGPPGEALLRTRELGMADYAPEIVPQGVREATDES